MRICNIIQCANLGGMERSSLLLLEDLKARGHEVELLSLHPLGGLGPLLAQNEIPAEGLNYRGAGGWRSIWEFKRHLRRIKSDALIMTGHNLLASEALGDFCAERRILSIHFHHGGVKPPWQWRLIYRAALAKFSAIVFPSDFIREEAEAIYPAIKSISHTVGCPIALSAPPGLPERAEARHALGLPEHARIIGNAGWLIPRKRFDVFLQVARNVALQEPGAIFVIAGDGPQAEAMKSLADRIGIADRVRWLGWQSDLTTFYRSLDLLLFNSDWDAMGRTPLEALAAGVPIVASVLHGGLREIVNGENYGPVYQRHDIDRLTAATVAILRNPRFAAELVEAGRNRLRHAASPTRHADVICGLLGGDSGMEWQKAG
jgi:glycosyltransferase involved in cell wall biosynthesis